MCPHTHCSQCALVNGFHCCRHHSHFTLSALQGRADGVLYATTTANTTTFCFAPDHVFHAQLEQANQDELAQLFAEMRRRRDLSDLDKRRYVFR